METETNIEKKVELDLSGTDGNAFAVMGNFRRAAKAHGWTKAEIDAVLNEAMKGDYDHLLATVLAHCTQPYEAEQPDDGTDER